MRQQRLVEVECIDDVIEQLKHVRDNYETEHDEQGMELATVKQQRDELLAALNGMLLVYSEMINNPPYHHTQELWVKVEAAIKLQDAITKAQEGEE